MVSMKSPPWVWGCSLLCSCIHPLQVKWQVWLHNDTHSKHIYIDIRQ